MILYDRYVLTFGIHKGVIPDNLMSKYTQEEQHEYLSTLRIIYIDK